MVNAKCYASEERNTNKYAGTADRDVSMEVRFCAPKAESKTFPIVLPDGESVKLDPAGNARAAELVRSAPKGSLLEVTVTGNRIKDSINVDSLSVDT